jgi:hypothetical protein
LDVRARQPFSRERLSAAKPEAGRPFTKHDQPNGERRDRICPTNAELRRGGEPNQTEERKERTDGGEEAIGAECAAAETDRNASLQQCERWLHDERGAEERKANIAPFRVHPCSERLY